ncbi:MAG: diaminopimelate decarboxylase [Gammaproteobacteria bacterium]|nr:diaminopimelate decarboxylase [Gammaproteobacteria bacterium]
MTTSTLDSATGLQRNRGQLQLDGVALDEIAARFDTPSYVYSHALIDANWRRYAAAAGAAGSVHYAVKANPCGAILQHLARLGAGFDIVSAHEMRRVLQAGGRASSIVFSGVGKRDEELNAALVAGIGCFNIESVDELQRLDRLAQSRGTTATVALRVNPDVTPDTHRHIATGGGTHKFGIEQARIADVAQLAQGMPGIALDGLAMHIGSQICDLDPIVAATRALRRLADQLRANGLPIHHLDLGGGLVTGDAAPTIEHYIEALREAAGSDYRLAFEPGRSIVAEAGLMLTRVVAIKRNGDRQFAIVDAGMNDFLRPALYDAMHPIVAVAESDTAPASYDIVGPVCETADTLGHQRELSLSPGSLVAMLETGAYGAAMSSHYNSRPRCAEIMVIAGEARLVRQRESFDDLVRHEQLLEY